MEVGMKAAMEVGIEVKVEAVAGLGGRYVTVTRIVSTWRESEVRIKLQGMAPRR